MLAETVLFLAEVPRKDEISAKQFFGQAVHINRFGVDVIAAGSERLLRPCSPSVAATRKL